MYMNRNTVAIIVIIVLAIAVAWILRKELMAVAVIHYAGGGRKPKKSDRKIKQSDKDYDDIIKHPDKYTCVVSNKPAVNSVKTVVVKNNIHKIKYHLKQCGLTKNIRGATIVASFIRKPPQNKILNRKLWGLFAHPNSIKFFDYQCFERYKYMTKDYPIFHDFIKWHDKHGFRKVIVGSGFISLIMGIRYISDVDIFSHTIIKNVPYFIDADKTPKDVEERRQLLLAIHKDKNLDFNDDRNFMYFMGIKCSTPEVHAYSRFLRQRPKAIAELMLMKKYAPKLKVKIPPIPKYKMVVPAHGGYSYEVDNYMNIEVPFLNPNYKQSEIYKKWIRDRVPVDREDFQRLINKYYNQADSI